MTVKDPWVYGLTRLEAKPRRILGQPSIVRGPRDSFEGMCRPLTLLHLQDPAVGCEWREMSLRVNNHTFACDIATIQQMLSRIHEVVEQTKAQDHINIFVSIKSSVFRRISTYSVIGNRDPIAVVG